MSHPKIALVTGGRKGIGRGCADRLVAEGYFVIVTGRQETAELGDSRMAYLPCNQLDLEQVRTLVQKVFRQYGRVDLLVNNAGVAPKKRMDILDVDEESYDFVVDTNCKGTFFMCQSMAKAMLELKKREPDYRPRIINLSSVSAYTASVNRGEYCISKAGISMVTQLFAARLAEAGIPVFEIRPGIIETDMIQTVRVKYQQQVEEGLTPIRRLGTPKDIGDCVAALASGCLDFAAGQVIDADGGFHIRRL